MPEPAVPSLRAFLSPLTALLLLAGQGLSPLAAGAQSSLPIRSNQRRPTVSVPDFKNNVTAGTWWWQGPVAQDLAAALANELQATGDLQVVERRNLKEVLSEQELAELGIVRKGTGSSAAQKSQMTGARYIVLGTVSSYDSNVESKGSGSNFGLMGVGTAKEQLETKDYVAIDIRVVDSSTGEVVGSRTVEGRASNAAEAQSTGVSLLPAAALALLLAPNMGRTGQVLTGAAGTLNFGNRNSQSQRTPAAKALRAALIDASSYVSCLLVPKPGCLAAFEAQEQERRERTRGVLKLD
ncbi:CsgG/HfaB family protein [Cyanobium sp. Morenito 9A2]|uniref:CsgG/HfaB family protein n=1 Tax=Cyanobium sp. Morenito 9A2 TaxID=2823718 RepID=UPI0020CF46B4|nr:CsgG/HfaB family protein [Cyanobium sp. Morenito 9A2]MCP9850969.1 penicillin-binding protein activator LpoB [Cyanobium sp. Morenito 9A2]